MLLPLSRPIAVERLGESRALHLGKAAQIVGLEPAHVPAGDEGGDVRERQRLEGVRGVPLHGRGELIELGHELLVLRRGLLLRGGPRRSELQGHLRGRSDARGGVPRVEAVSRGRGRHRAADRSRPSLFPSRRDVGAAEARGADARGRERVSRRSRTRWCESVRARGEVGRGTRCDGHARSLARLCGARGRRREGAPAAHTSERRATWRRQDQVRGT